MNNLSGIVMLSEAKHLAKRYHKAGRPAHSGPDASLRSA